MTERRWGLGAWFVVWALIFGAQVAAGLYLFEAQPALAVLVVAVLQVAKIPPTLWRLNDLGRPTDDLIYLLPPLNLGLFFQVLAGTPRDDLRERRMRQWRGQVSALAAWRQGWTRLMGSASVVLLPTLIVAAVASAAVEGVGAMISGAIPAREAVGGAAVAAQDAALLEQGLLTALAVVGLYTLMQYVKASTASRASWLPSLLLLPLLLVWLAVRFRSAAGQLGVMLASLPGEAANMAITPLLAGFIVSLWVAAATKRADGQWPSGSEAWGVARERMAEVAAIWGGRTQWTWLGMQVLILGIWFAVSYALADILAVIRPEKRSYAASIDLVRGARSRVFKILVVWFYLTVIGLRTLVLLPLIDPTVIGSSLFVPEMVEPTAQALVSFVSWWPSWWCTLALLVLLEEREQVREAQRAAA